MRICKSVASAVTFCAVFASCGSVLFAQTIEMPEMPQMPAMPEISAEGSFYRPSLPYVPSQGTRTAAQDSSQSQDSSSSQTVLTETVSDQDLLSSLIGSRSTLTASDISDLYDSGLFTTVSSLNGGSIATSNLLQRTLTNLSSLKESRQDISQEQKEVIENHQTDARTFKQREPSILRFKINGYSITDSLTSVFFSDPEPDGTFLLTADRRYFVNQLPRTETFYMLFRTVSSSGSSVSYKVQPMVVQDSKNENSFVYRLASAKNLTAEKTGNLVVMHFAEDDLKVEMLLDIDKK